MTQLSDRLQGALGDAFKLERELKPGGMSRLFLATERSLNRRVVIKLLPPDMTSEVSAARFKQEIELAAQLQHPNILPILSAGSHNDLIYYVMPFISGESLRHRLINEGRTSIESARQIIREVADALAYAHGHGIGHRDIKPENILLEEGHAVLTDFGVARAIGEARGDDRLTATGMGVGTPGYMAPEQAAGERHVDARADVYALAVVAYEMLAGAPPFEGDTPQAVLAAHLTQDPSPVKDTRPDTPAEFDAAIAKALAKRPEDRFQTAAEFRDAIAPVAASGAHSPVTSRRWAFAAGAAVVVLLVGALALWPRGGGFEGDPRLSLVVFPFENRTGDPANDWLEEASMNLVGLGLAHWEELRVFDDERTASLMRRNDIAGAGDLDFDAAQAMARVAKVGTLVMGDIRREGDSLAFEAKIHDVTSGDRLETQIVRVVASADPRAAFDSLTARILHVSGAPLGDRPGAIAQTTASLEAYRDFIAGTEAIHRLDWQGADSLFNRAIATDSTFALAYVQLMLVGGWTGGGVSAALAAKAQAHAADLPPRLRSLVAFHNAYANDQLGRARDIAVQLIERDSTDVEAWYQLGEAHLHDGSGWPGGFVPLPHEDSLGNVGRALRAFQRSLAIDSTYTIAYFHTVDVLGLCGTPSASFVCLADSAVYGSAEELAGMVGQVTIDSLRAVALEEQVTTAYGWLAEVPNDEVRGRLIDVLLTQDRYDEVANQAALLGGADVAAKAKAKAFEAAARVGQLRFREAGTLAHEALVDLPDSVPFRPWIFYAAGGAIAGGRVAEGRDAGVKFFNEFPGFPQKVPLYGVMVPKEVFVEYFAFLMVSSTPDSSLIRRSADEWLDLLTGAFARDTASIGVILRGTSIGFDSPYLAAYLGSRDTTVLLPLLDATGPDDWPSGRAQLALARGDTARARALLDDHFADATIANVEEFVVMYAWADLLARLGDPGAGLAAYQRLDSARLSLGLSNQTDVMLLIISWAERGALYQQLGRKDEAIEMYEKLIDAWRDGDQHVQPSVERARRAVRVLRGEVEVGEPEVGS
ncbi:MAG: protein kinase [Gemmatimonadetes bacterium]|nr:protein kinase [Gemmatimonadota bacterium]